jgi:hypothetical protein
MSMQMKNKIYSTTRTPKKPGDMQIILHNLNVEVARDLKKAKIDDGYIWTQIDTLPFRYLARYVSNDDDVKMQENQKLIPVPAFIEYMRGK